MRILILLTLFAVSACLKPAERQNRAHIVDSMAKTLDKQFPGVASVTKETLPIGATLIDLRSPAEQSISTLPGAISKKIFEAKKENFKNQKIVAFDTLGQRSIPWVSEMRAQGFDAYNLHGGILAWAHSGGKFVDVTGETTKRVHVYAQAWDMLPDGFEAITE